MAWERYRITKRNYSEAFANCSKRRNETNIKKFGHINPLSKGTDSYKKKLNTIKEKYGVDNVFQIQEIKNKIQSDEFWIEKYGITLRELKSIKQSTFFKNLTKEEISLFINKRSEKCKISYEKNYKTGHPSREDSVKNKTRTTNIIIYGSEYYFQSKEFLNNTDIKQKVKEIKIKNGYIISDEEMGPFLTYKRNCRKLTERVKKKLYENWDGYDYYDGEYIKENKNLNNTNPSYPTIDHKISIFYGFMNNISEISISDINNLCITKRSINCSKRNKNNYETISKNITL